MFKRYWWMFLAMVPVGVLGCFLIAAIITYLTPTEYESTAVIEISDHRQRVNGMESQEPRTETLFQTEIEKITARNPLKKAVKALDLTNRWGLDHEATLAALNAAVKPKRIPRTDLISITVRHTNREDARDIAAEVSKAYIAYGRELVEKPMVKVVSELKKVVLAQEDVVEEKRKVMNLISRREDAASGESRDYIDAKRDLETELALLQEIKLKLVALEIERDSGGLNPVVVHDDPVISQTPVSPNVTRNLVSGSIAGFFLSPFLALPLMWLANRKHAAPFSAKESPDSALRVQW